MVPMIPPCKKCEFRLIPKTLKPCKSCKKPERYDIYIMIEDMHYPMTNTGFTGIHELSKME